MSDDPIRLGDPDDLTHYMVAVGKLRDDRDRALAAAKELRAALKVADATMEYHNLAADEEVTKALAATAWLEDR